MISISLKPFSKHSWHAVSSANVSPWVMNKLCRFIKIGADCNRIPFSTIVKALELSFPMQQTFRIPSLPIREYLIAPLRCRLKDLGVTIVLNTKIKSLSPKDLNVRAVVAAIPPSAYNAMDTSRFAVTMLTKLYDEAQHQQISFRIFFKERLRYPSRCTFELHQSSWGLVIIPADLFYTERHWSSSVWTGTVTFMHKKDRFGRTPTECTAEEFQESVILQLMECKQLHEWFARIG